MNDLHGSKGGGSAEPRFPTIAEPEHVEPDMTWRDWAIAVSLGAFLAVVIGAAVYVAAMVLGAVIALVF